MDDDQELELKAGDVITQRGANHARVNRSDQTVRMLFIIIGADFDPAMGIDAPWPPAPAH